VNIQENPPLTKASFVRGGSFRYSEPLAKVLGKRRKIRADRFGVMISWRERMLACQYVEEYKNRSYWKNRPVSSPEGASHELLRRLVSQPWVTEGNPRKVSPNVVYPEGVPQKGVFRPIRDDTTSCFSIGQPLRGWKNYRDRVRGFPSVTHGYSKEIPSGFQETIADPKKNIWFPTKLGYFLTHRCTLPSK